MRQFGLIGYPLGHSFSKGYFTEKFLKEHIDARYDAFPLEQIDTLPELLKANPELEGLNVTIPYKQQVLPFLHELSPVVQAIGACNCIHVKNGMLKGYNTDVAGFEKSLTPMLEAKHNRALILGTGGASQAVQFVLHKLRIPFTVISRKADTGAGIRDYASLDAEMLRRTKLWINTTPLGMHPHTEELPPLDYSCLTADHYLYDLIYNPGETRFLSRGRAAGALTHNGHEMLIIQAEESWAIWNAG